HRRTGGIGDERPDGDGLNTRAALARHTGGRAPAVPSGRQVVGRSAVGHRAGNPARRGRPPRATACGGIAAGRGTGRRVERAVPLVAHDQERRARRRLALLADPYQARPVPIVRRPPCALARAAPTYWPVVLGLPPVARVRADHWPVVLGLPSIARVR